MKIVQTVALALGFVAMSAFAADKAPSAQAAPVKTATTNTMSTKAAPVKVASATKEEKEAAKEACKTEGVKGKKAIKACVKGKLSAPKGA